MTKKLKIIISASVIGLTLASVGAFSLKPDKGLEEDSKNKTVSIVKASDFQSVEGYVYSVGEVKSLDQVILSSEISGTIETVFVEIGDYVKTGDPILQFQGDVYDAQLAQADAYIKKAEASLDQRNAGPTTQEIQQAQASIKQAEASLRNSEISYEQSLLTINQTLSDAERALQIAENNLRNSTEGEVSELLVQEYIDLMTRIKNSYSILNNILQDSDELLGINNAGLNDSFEDSLSARDGQYLVDARNSFVALQAILDNKIDEVNALSSNSSFEEITELADDAIDALSTSESHLYAMIGMLNNTPESSSLTATEINTYVGIFTTNLTTVQNGISFLFDDIEALEAVSIANANAQLNYESTLLAYEQAKLNVDYQKELALSNIEIQKANLEISQVNYELLIADPRDVDLASFQASISEAKASYALALANKNKTIIRSPINGQISMMDLSKGTFVGATQNVASIVNAEQLEVSASISASDLKWIKIGDPVLVNENIEGEVYLVSPGLNFNTKKVEIRVLITSEDPDLTVGEFVQIEIMSSLTDAKDSTYYIPLSAIKMKSSKAYIYFVNEDGIVDSKEIELGDVQGEKVEVLKGLELEDEFIESVRNIDVGNKVQYERI